MKSLYLIYLSSLLSLLLVSSCNPQRQFINRMEGVWNIAQEEIVLINPAGSTDPVSSGTDIGVLTLEAGDFIDQSAGSLYYTLELTNSNFSWRDLSFKTDPERKRVFFYNFYCDDLFGCDMIATIIEDKPNQQVYSFIRRAGSTNGGSIHRKTTWTLERQ
jgi:hypothetical protein